jgi:chromosome segregation ATPase
MFALVDSSWLPPVAAFLSGLLVKWLLDLFFLRRSIFETQEALLTRERQITDLRHELNRSVETLKNRTTELDATIKAKAAAEAASAQHQAAKLAAADQSAAELSALKQARTGDQLTAETLRGEIQALLGHVSGERLQRHAAESEALDLRLRLAEAEALALDQGCALEAVRQTQAVTAAENEALRPLLEQARRDLAAQLTVNAALQGAVQLRDTTLEGVRTQLASAESECQSVSRLLARQDEERARMAELQTALAEAEARCAARQSEADAARQQLESIQTQRMDFEAALMLKEAQANAWERECRTAKNRADTAARKSTQDAQALETIRAQLEACRAELDGGRTTPAPPVNDPGASLRIADLESELATVSESHARLESQLAETKAMASRAEDLSEQLGIVEAELAALKLEPSPSGSQSSGDLDALLQDLDALTRERNLLAAEVAALKSAGHRVDPT